MVEQDGVTWYVVADGGKARILKSHGNSMATVSSFDSAGHGDTGENDQAEIAGIHAPSTDPHAQVKALFARQVATHLSQAAEAHQVDHIVLAAPGHVLHEIVEALNKPATAALERKISKDLTNIPDHDLAAHFSGGG
jgi:protein required for attachment to host cells